MSELAIVIRFSVNHLIKPSFENDTEDSESVLRRNGLATRNYLLIVRITYIACTLFALTSIICATYLWVWLIVHDASGNYNFEDMMKLLEEGVPKYWDFNRMASGILLSILSFGLIVSFIFLVHSIRKYYDGQMEVEMRWLSILFAIFSICYGLRTVYQFLLGDFHIYVPDMIFRWHCVNLLPIVFDVIPICAILIMHHLNFRTPRRRASS